jgi:mannose/cellobiose epimerase-like protein (N-acyl-D-glucosamine 2-epimerase family)
MVYGLAHGASVDPSYLHRAKRSAEFLLTKMVRRDATGPYFLSAVDAQGSEVTPKTELVVNEQAYGLNGLVALYQVTRDPRLLDTIREAYAAFYKRFHDAEHGGFFDTFDRATGKPVRTKSYNSTVYVATSFLLELSAVDTERKAGYEKVLRELGDRVAGDFFDPKTGWIVENFTNDWKPEWRGWQKQGENTIGVVGHNFQAAWFLMRLADTFEGDATRQAKYRATAREILGSMLDKPVVDWERGGFGDVFKRETSEPMWHTNKAWWQQAEAILSLTLAERDGILSGAAADRAKIARDQGLAFYLKHFIDRKNGGEFDNVDKDGNPTPDAVKGSLGKSTYHTVELARYMTDYAVSLKRPAGRVTDERGQTSCKQLFALAGRR